MLVFDINALTLHDVCCCTDIRCEQIQEGSLEHRESFELRSLWLFLLTKHKLIKFNHLFKCFNSVTKPFRGQCNVLFKITPLLLILFGVTVSVTLYVQEFAQKSFLSLLNRVLQVHKSLKATCFYHICLIELVREHFFEYFRS